MVWKGKECFIRLTGGSWQSFFCFACPIQCSQLQTLFSTHSRICLLPQFHIQSCTAQWSRCQIGCSCSKNLPCRNYRRIICSCSYYMEHPENTFFFVEEKKIGHRKRKKIFGKGKCFFWNTEKKWAKQLQYFMGVGGPKSDYVIYVRPLTLITKPNHHSLRSF